MPLWFPALLLAAHLLYFSLLLPSLSGRAVGAVGCVVALALLVAPVLSPNFADRTRHEFGMLRRRLAWLLLACFVLPVLSLLGQPTLGFVRLDARALLIVAWLIALAWIVIEQQATRNRLAPRPARGHLPLVTHLFILWSAIFWLMVIWDLGVGHAVVTVTREDRLTASFKLWETRPASEHLFLVWLSSDSFHQGIAYTNHLHPVLLFWYTCSKLVQLATGLPPYIGRNLIPVAVAGVGVLAFSALVPRRLSNVHYGVRFHATLFAALGFYLSEWHFWVYAYGYNFDTVFPLIVFLAAIAWASAQPRISATNAGRVTAALVVFAAFGGLYTPLLIAAVWFLFGRAGADVASTLAANRPLMRASIAAVGVGFVTYALPLLLVALKGYENQSSSWLFRSGLDGDTRYFQNVVQAVFQPFAPSRAWWSLLFPVCVPLLLAGACAWQSGGSVVRRFGRQALFFVTPYLFSVAVFPQALSIHPYLYDELLLLPLALIGSTWMLSRCVQDRLRGASALAALLIAAVLIMANLIGVAQGVLSVSAR